MRCEEKRYLDIDTLSVDLQCQMTRCLGSLQVLSPVYVCLQAPSTALGEEAANDRGLLLSGVWKVR